MRLVFNPTGTQVRSFLEGRFDFIPSELDEAYKVHPVYVPVIPEDATEEQLNDPDWIASLPHIWKVNPCLIMFVTLPELVTADMADDWAERFLDKGVIASLDYIWKGYHEGTLVKPVSHYISHLMRDRGKYSTQKVITQDHVDLVASVNQIFSGKNIDLGSGGAPRVIEPESIDVGDPSIERANYMSSGFTRMSKGNPANGDGTLTTIEVWCHFQTMGGTIAGTFYNVSGTTYKCRDSTLLGDITHGSNQVIDISADPITVVTGDMIGQYYTSGSIEKSDSGGSGHWWAGGEHIDPDDEAVYGSIDNSAISMYGTGTESGGGQPAMKRWGGIPGMQYHGMGVW
jgi:hypothetical protein